MGWLLATQDGCIVTVKATPRARKTEVAGADPDWLRVRVQAPPVDGKANAELTAFFAKALGIPKRSVVILTGDTSRLKRVKLLGLNAEAVTACLAP